MQTASVRLTQTLALIDYLQPELAIQSKLQIFTLAGSAEAYYL